MRRSEPKCRDGSLDTSSPPTRSTRSADFSDFSLDFGVTSLGWASHYPIENLEHVFPLLIAQAISAARVVLDRFAHDDESEWQKFRPVYDKNDDKNENENRDDRDQILIFIIWARQFDK